MILAPQAEDQLDADAGGRHVHEPALLQEEMVVLGGIGVEIGLGAVHRELAKADFRELSISALMCRSPCRTAAQRRDNGFGGRA